MKMFILLAVLIGLPFGAFASGFTYPVGSFSCSEVKTNFDGKLETHQLDVKVTELNIDGVKVPYVEASLGQVVSGQVQIYRGAKGFASILILDPAVSTLQVGDLKIHFDFKLRLMGSGFIVCRD